MFLTDQKAESVSLLEPAQSPLTFCISQNPQNFSMASKRAVQQIQAIEELVVEDPGMTQHSFAEDDLSGVLASCSHKILFYGKI